MNLSTNHALRTYLQEAHDALDMGKATVDMPSDIVYAPISDHRNAAIRAYRMGVAQAKIEAMQRMLGKDKRNEK